MLKNKRGDIAIFFSLGVSALFFGYIGILQVIHLSKVRINLQNMLALDGYLSNEIYAWHGYLTKKKQGAGFQVSVDSKKSKYVVSGATICSTSVSGQVCLAAKEPDGTTGGSWEQVNATGAVAALIGGSQSLWTGTALIAWNGMDNVGGIFSPVTNQWKRMSPAPLEHISRGGVVWTGDRMFLYGALYSGTYDPANASKFWDRPTGCFAYFYSPEKDQWVAHNLRIPGQYYEDILCRYGSFPQWTGSKILITTNEYSWGQYTSIIWSFDPRNNTVAKVATVPSDLPISNPVSSGNKLLYYACSAKKGYIYDSDSNNWSPISPTNAPGCGSYSSNLPLSAGSKVIYWYGTDGGIYDPSINRWDPINTAKAPQPSLGMLRVWTGVSMIVWGGSGDCINNNSCATGAIYDPVKRTWIATKNDGAPKGTAGSAAAWVSNRALVFGGTYSYIDQSKGIIHYNVPSSDTYYYYPNGK